MSIVLNQDVSGLWQYVIVSSTGATIRTSDAEYQVPEVALAFARLWLRGPYGRES